MKNNVELPHMTELLPFVGKAQSGKKVFTTATCATCHIVNGEGTDFGPDLSDIGNKAARSSRVPIAAT